MGVFVIGVVGIVVFYLVILALGLWAARKRKEGEEETMLAGRNIGPLLGSFTVTATWVGGGYINGTAEIVYTSGLAYAQAPLGYTISLIVAGTFFAKIFRRRKYITIIDPYQEQFGAIVGSLMYIPAAMGEIFWSAAILSALGATVSVVIGLGRQLSVIVSSCIVVSYTLIGGLYSVAYTDIIQLLSMFIGLWLSIPFAMTNEAVSSISSTSSTWLGEWPENYGNWIDVALLLIFGGFPWQMYFQRVLACKNPEIAQTVTYVGAAGALIMTIPPILIGAVGVSTDWSKTDLLHTAINATNATAIKPEGLLILPLVLRYLTPNYVAFFGLGAVSAAVMSSMDSSFLACSSMFTHNIYKGIIRQKATQRELLWVLRIGIVVVGALTTLMSLTTDSVYALFALCSDLVYVIVFPQLVCVTYVPSANAYGSLAGFILGLILRVLGGEPLLGLPAIIKYPYYSVVHGQMFPFRTLAMVCSLVVIIGLSHLMRYLFTNDVLPEKMDFLHCFRQDSFDLTREDAQKNSFDLTQDAKGKEREDDNIAANGQLLRMGTLS